MIRTARILLASFATLLSLAWLTACSDGQREVVGPGVIGSGTEVQLLVDVSTSTVQVVATAECALDPEEVE